MLEKKHKETPERGTTLKPPLITLVNTAKMYRAPTVCQKLLEAFNPCAALHPPNSSYELGDVIIPFHGWRHRSEETFLNWCEAELGLGRIGNVPRVGQCLQHPT